MLTYLRQSISAQGRILWRYACEDPFEDCFVLLKRFSRVSKLPNDRRPACKVEADRDDWHSGGAGDVPVAALPRVDLLACPLRGDGEHHPVAAHKLGRHLRNHIVGRRTHHGYST